MLLENQWRNYRRKGNVWVNKGPDFQVSLESDLRKDLQADSVELMEFIINLEDEYQIEIPDKAIDEFNTVGDVVDYIEKRTAGH